MVPMRASWRLSLARTRRRRSRRQSRLLRARYGRRETHLAEEADEALTAASHPEGTAAETEARPACPDRRRVSVASAGCIVQRVSRATFSFMTRLPLPARRP